MAQSHPPPAARAAPTPQRDASAWLRDHADNPAVEDLAREWRHYERGWEGLGPDQRETVGRRIVQMAAEGRRRLRVAGWTRQTLPYPLAKISRGELDAREWCQDPETRAILDREADAREDARAAAGNVIAMPPRDQDQAAPSAGGGKRQLIQYHAVAGLLSRGYVTLSGEVMEPRADLPTGWGALAPGRVTAEARQWLHDTYPERRGWRAARIRDIAADLTDTARPAGAAAVERDPGATVDIDSGEVLAGRLWADRRVVYHRGRIDSYPLPAGRLWTGSGRLPWSWSESPPPLPARIAAYLDAFGWPPEERDYLLAVIGRGLLGAATKTDGSPLPCLVGIPESGKSTLLDFIERLLAGPVVSPAGISALAARFGRSDLPGASMIRLDESDKTRDGGYRAGTAILIKIADGQPIQIEDKGRKPYTARIGAAPWLAANTPPLDVQSRSDGLARRVKVFDLCRRFGSGPDPLADVSAAEYGAAAVVAAHLWATTWGHRPAPASILRRTSAILDAARPALDRYLDGFTLRTDGGPGIDMAALLDGYRRDYGEEITAEKMRAAIRSAWPTATGERHRIDGRRLRVYPLRRREDSSQ